MAAAPGRSGRDRSSSALTPVCESWIESSPREVLALLHAEYTRWSVDLGWDLSRDWATVEPARRSGLVPGWIARDGDGRPRGWAFGVDQPGTRQVGAIVADDPEIADRLIAAIVDDDSRDLLLFIRTSAVVGATRLRALGFTVQPYRYLVAPTPTRRPTPRADAAGARCDAWSDGDLAATAALFADAYAGDGALRPFARHGSIDEWVDYVESVTLRPGCGVFSPEASVAVRVDGRLAAVALVTSIGPTTAHLAQLAVAPAARGRGLSWMVLDAARTNAARVLNASRCSLLVSDANRVASSLYARAGFTPAGEFLAAYRGAGAAQPLRSISTAPATGGESARR